MAKAFISDITGKLVLFCFAFPVAVCTPQFTFSGDLAIVYDYCFIRFVCLEVTVAVDCHISIVARHLPEEQEHGRHQYLCFPGELYQRLKKLVLYRLLCQDPGIDGVSAATS